MTLSVTINDETPAARLAVDGDTLAEPLIQALQCVGCANSVTDHDVSALHDILYRGKIDYLGTSHRLSALEILGLIEHHTWATWRLTRMGKRAIAMLAAAA